MPMWSGKSIKWAGAGLLISGGVLGYAVSIVPGADTGDAMLVLSLLPIPMVLGGAFLFYRGRQLEARKTAPKIIGDTNPDVLYLRAFSTDPSLAGQVFSSLLTAKVFSGLATEEEQLRDALAEFGDLVAVGEPDERLPRPGAAKLYASDAEWQDIVRRQMRDAPLVIIRAGNSKGLFWELSEAVQDVEPRSLLILVLNMRKKQYVTFIEHARDVFPKPLPGLDTVSGALGMKSGFIRFADDWTADFLVLKTPFFRGSAYRPLRRLFKFALRPVFEEHGVEWTEPPVSVSRVLATTVLALFAVLMMFTVVMLL